MLDYQTMMMMAQQIQEEENKEKEARVTIPCYGCAHMCASPVSCTHPNGLSVRYDPVRKMSYRLPSVELCYTESGLCKFYEPHEERGAEYAAVQRKILKKAHKDKVERIDKTIDKIYDENTDIDDYIDELTQLAKEMDKDVDKDGKK